jgi:hypothetical protein
MSLGWGWGPGPPDSGWPGKVAHLQSDLEGPQAWLDRVEESEANDWLDLFPKLTVEMRCERPLVKSWRPLGTRLLTLLASFFRIVSSLAGAGNSSGSA